MIAMLESVLRRPKTVFVLMLALVVAGVTAYFAIPKEDTPDIDVPVFYISVSQQGISPEDAERLLVRPMETELRGLDGLKEITAIASEGHAAIILEFDISFDKDEALADVRDKVDQAKSKLPAEADEPTISETNFALLPTITVTLSGNVPERTLYQHARRLKAEIEAIDTVRSADLSGHREELLEVLIDTRKLESYSITQEELITSLTQNNQLVPAGFLDSGKGRFNVKVPGLVETAQDVYALPLKQSGEGLVTLGDVAEIRRTFKDATSYTRVNGRPAIALQVTKRIGTNVIENNDAVRSVVQAAAADWPETIRVDIMLDQSANIYEVLGSLQSSILTAIFLVMVLVVASLGLRSALLVGLAIPTSFMVGFLILSGLGYTVNTMVMFGLVLTVGMLVDGAIVMVEYADRKIAEGMEDREAYIRAAKLMFWPIVSSTATTLAAFLPMLLWPGVAGEFMSYLPIMVIIVLTASLLTAMVFLPVTGGIFAAVSHWTGRHATGVLAFAFALATAGALLSAPLADGLRQALAAAGFLGAGLVAYRLLRPLVAWSRARAARRAEEDRAAAALLSGAQAFDVREIRGATGLYVRILKLLAGNPVGNVVTVVAVVGLCAAIFVAFGANNAGVEFFVEEEPEQAIVLVSARGNLSAAEARDLVGEVEDVVLRIEGIENVVTAAYAPGGGGGGKILGGVQDKPADTVGELQIEFADYCCRRKAAEIFREIRERTAFLPGIKVETRKIEMGPPSGKDVQLEVKSTDYATLTATVARIRAHMDTMPGLLDQEDDRPLPGIEWQLTIDREQAGRYQAGIVSVGSMVQLVTNGVLIGKYRPTDSEDEVDIRVRLPQDERTLDRFDQLRLQTPLGLVPLANFVERAPAQKVSSITRRDGLYSMMLKAGVDKDAGVLADDKVRELDAWLKGQTWPTNVYLKFRGADEDQKESGEFLMRAMVASLFLMFVILLTQFNSFYQTFLTLSTVVMSVMGVLLGMLITGQKFSIIMTGTGIVALAGIVVNNAIVLLDTYNRFREDGMESLDAILKTSAQRIRPIMLTTITTIAGLIPMATQVNFDFFNQVTAVGSITAIWWIQLSTAVIFGLGFSTILTLILIPTMIAAPGVWTASARRLWNRATGDRSAPAAAGTAAAVAEAAPAHAGAGVVSLERPEPARSRLDGLPHAAE
ncbi:efflux RND transporter permease subunit [Polymorphum gilvum]|uniref:RND transporter, HAE1/HME family, permease protein n=1 Tax=Polymorphum gilvum (strain LMG 25793 / CGMCC 1.9160 / SL003B-26A1) TaxID=991905 RepID=F2J592_POLGS|nr:efflux RND transporter permease subunit [Polymorphum gilvum]ADZ71151.1 RND transporter, HAE1/HME family, permease protein [Polymorphum gilvum SL003B-26A1]